MSVWVFLYAINQTMHIDRCRQTWKTHAQKHIIFQAKLSPPPGHFWFSFFEDLFSCFDSLRDQSFKFHKKTTYRFVIHLEAQSESIYSYGQLLWLKKDIPQGIISIFNICKSLFLFYSIFIFFYSVSIVTFNKIH